MWGVDAFGLADYNGGNRKVKRVLHGSPSRVGGPGRRSQGGVNADLCDDELTLPRVAKGAARCNRPAEACPVLAAGFIATGIDEAVVAEKREWVREYFSFLYSTPAYSPTLEHHGWRLQPPPGLSCTCGVWLRWSVAGLNLQI